MSRKRSADIPPTENFVSQAEVQPWHRLGGMEHICELRKNSQVLYAIFVSILRMIYSSKDGRTFGCPDVVWKQNVEKTEIWIDTELRWEDQRPDFTPAIFVSLGELKYEPITTIDMQGRISISADGEQHYERTVRGSANIIHVSDKAGAACSLADNTENYMSSLQDQIGDEYCFDNFLVTGRIPRQQKEQQQTAGKGKYISVVAVQFEFTDAWTVKIESPILKVVSMMERESSDMNIGKDVVQISGSGIDVSGGTVEIQFGDISTATDTPLDN